MKKHFIIFVIVLFFLESVSLVSSNNENNELIFYSDISWTKHTIENQINHVTGIHICDIDLDGDNDVLGSAFNDNEIAYWINNGENPISWIKHSIDDNFMGAIDVFTDDVDNDGDIDVLGASWNENKIKIWLNQGGDPIIWNEQVITSNFLNAHEVYTCDFDGDDDLDLFGASAGFNTVSWWRNNGGDPINWDEQIIDNTVGGARSVVCNDIDNDGDLDVLAAAFSTNEIIWWRNDGGEPVNWIKFIISDDFLGAHHVASYDIDKDGDYDVIGSAYFSDEIAWWSNDGGNPIIWSKQSIEESYNGAMMAFISDIDNDGDNDILGSSSLSNNIAWWRNDGGDPIIWTKFTIDMMCSRAWEIFASDLDGDGDLDVIGGSESSGGIKWYESNLYTYSDLECEGSLNWIDVKPGAVVNKTFSVKNNGKSFSILNWEIIGYPEWGNWTFSPKIGSGLSYGDKIDVVITLEAPNEDNMDFEGNIVISNIDAIDDKEILQVKLTTIKNKFSNKFQFFRIFDSHSVILRLLYILQTG